MTHWTLRCTILVVLWNFLLVSVKQFTQATCPLTLADQTTLVWDYNSEAFVSLDGLQSSSNSSNRLLQAKRQPLEFMQSFNPLSSSHADAFSSGSRSALSSRKFNRSDLVNVTECYCAFPDSFTYYCPLEVNSCEVIRGWKPRCIRQSSKDLIISSVWPVTMTAMFLLLGLLFFSFRGKCAWGYMIALFYPDWNKRAVESLLRRNRNIAHQLIRQAHERQRQRVEDRYLEFLAHNPGYVFTERNQSRSRQEEPKVLRLKTKVYRSNSTCISHGRAVNSSQPVESSPTSSSGISTSEDEASSTPVLKDHWAKNSSLHLTAEEELALTEDHACAICYASMVDGEKVGALACGHLLHVDCLKVWLKRRNVCPLCLTEAATVSASSVENGGTN